MSGERENLVSSRLADMMALDAADPVWRPDELGAIDFKIIDIDEVFVVVAAAHLVLRTEFAARSASSS